MLTEVMRAGKVREGVGEVGGVRKAVLLFISVLLACDLCMYVHLALPCTCHIENNFSQILVVVEESDLDQCLGHPL